MARASHELELQRALPAILDYLDEHQVVVIAAPPGSSKSTLLPKLLAVAGYGPVICAQPRHVAVTTAADRAGEWWNSHIKFTTTRRLVEEFCTQPVLAMYGAIVVDEAHDRTLCTDVLLGLLKAFVASGRGFNKVVVCTADGTDRDKLCEFFSIAPVVACQRVVHLVEVCHTPGPVLDVVRAAVDVVEQIHASQPPGDVLVFLPGLVEMEEADKVLKHRSPAGLVTCVLHDHLPSKLKGAVFAPAPDGMRKVVLASGVAETAVLVGGIKYVVDSGIESAQPLKMISKESARRRMSRAGDHAPGRCYRLYTESDYVDLDDNAVPEIERDGALTRLVLMLKSHRIDDVAGLDFVDPPPATALEQTIDKLVADGYLDEHGALTDKGEQAAYQEE